MRWLAILLVMAALPNLARATQAGEGQAWEGHYPEGPIWIGDTLYWAEMSANRIMAWSGGAPRIFLEADGCGPTALAPLDDDRLVVLCHLAPGLMVIDRQGAVVSRITHDTEGRALRDPNDASADGEGGVWITDPGTFWAAAPAQGAVLYLSADGLLMRHVDGLAYGNGVFVTDQHLLVSEHLARRIVRYPREDGRLGPAEIVIDLDALGLPRVPYPEAGPDGLEIDPRGRLWIAEYGAGRVLVFDRTFRFLGEVPVPMPFVTNIAFGPGDAVAITGAYQNDRPPFEGAVMVTSLASLMQTIRPAGER